MKHIFTLLFIAALTLSSCSEKQEIRTGSSIDSSLKRAITAKNDSLIQALIENNSAVFKAIGTHDFYDKLAAHTSLVAKAFRPRRYTTGDYTPFDELQIVNGDKSSMQEYVSAEKGYTFRWANKHSNQYVSMLRMPFVGLDQLMLLWYVQDTDGKWKIDKMQFVPLGRYGLSPHDCYLEAKKWDKRNKKIMALSYARAGFEWSENMKDPITFPVGAEAKAYTAELADYLDEHYKLPFVVEEVSTKPSILLLGLEEEKEGFMPYVNYESTLGDDTIALKKEFEQLKKIVPKLYPDMDFRTKPIRFEMKHRVTDEDNNPFIEKKEYIANY